jgi:hypothetical protein
MEKWIRRIWFSSILRIFTRHGGSDLTPQRDIFKPGGRSVTDFILKELGHR